ncbi:MAG: type 4a pilus biogenesis protein PilO [Phycisphaeraceae bacterium]|nr:type 4a pilus biogenesis protein PilO [Phycisphaeraceae bacterium]
MSEPHDKQLRMIDLTAAAVCLLLTGGVYAVAVKPMLDEMSAGKQQQRELTEREQKADEMSTTLAKMRDTLLQTECTLDSQALKLEPLSQLNRRVAQFTALADACNLQLDQIEPSAAMAGTHYMTVPIHMTGRGGYVDATNFLKRLRQQWPDLAVASLDLTGNPRNRGDQPRFTFELIWFASPATGG